MYRIFFLIFLFSCLGASEVNWKQCLDDMPVQEKLYLEKFFRTMLVNSQGGYVLFGSKPSCGEGIFDIKSNIGHLGTRLHVRSSILFLGCKVWNRYFANISGAKISIILKKETSLGNWAYVVYWINKEKMLSVVERNLPLFQLSLGQSLTAQSFLDRFSEMDLKDNALIGIILGFGTKNSIYGKRCDQFLSYTFSKELLPFLPHKFRNADICKSFSYVGYDESKILKLTPSWGFANLTEEFQEIKRLSASSFSDEGILPELPLFSNYVDDEESREIIGAYREDRKKIKVLLGKKDFLESVMRIIFKK